MVFHRMKAPPFAVALLCLSAPVWKRQIAALAALIRFRMTGHEELSFPQAKTLKKNDLRYNSATL